MREAKTRKYHSPEFKAKVGLEALRGVKTINEIDQEYGVHPVHLDTPLLYNGYTVHSELSLRSQPISHHLHRIALQC